MKNGLLPKERRMKGALSLQPPMPPDQASRGRFGRRRLASGRGSWRFAGAPLMRILVEIKSQKAPYLLIR